MIKRIFNTTIQFLLSNKKKYGSVASAKATIPAACSSNAYISHKIKTMPQKNLAEVTLRSSIPNFNTVAAFLSLGQYRCSVTATLSRT